MFSPAIVLLVLRHNIKIVRPVLMEVQSYPPEWPERRREKRVTRLTVPSVPNNHAEKMVSPTRREIYCHGLGIGKQEMSLVQRQCLVRRLTSPGQSESINAGKT